MRERTVYITDRCPHGCCFCSGDCHKEGEQFTSTEDVLDWLAEEQAEFVHVSGGEPLRHPDFPFLWKWLRAKYGDNLCLHTNEIPHLAYNPHARGPVFLHANVCVSEDVTDVHVLKLVDQGRARQMPKVHVSGQWRDGACNKCDHTVRMPDGVTGPAPCKKFEAEE